MAKTMEHLSEFVFINVAKMTLARRDAYLAHINQPGKLLETSNRKERARIPTTPHARPRVSLIINDNQCSKFLLSKRLAGSTQTLIVNQDQQAGPGTVKYQTLNSCVNLNFYCINTSYPMDNC